MDCLKALLDPYPLHQFFQENWTKQAVFIPGTESKKFSHLFGWPQFNYLLNYHRIKYPDLRFSRDGESLPATGVDQWLERVQEGATLIIDSVHERVPELKKLVANIRQELGYRSQINLYCSPWDEKGFNCHYDSHEVIILQIAGEKDWFIFPETIAFPLWKMRSSDQIPPDVPPYLQCTLKPGDLLYIPRGHWHYAIACSNPLLDDYSPSLHLTLGIDCQTGLNWMNWLEKQLEENPQWRQSLPVIPQGDMTTVKPHLEQLRDRLIELLQNPDTIAGYLDYLSYSDRPTLPFSFPYQLGSQIFDQGLETRFRPSALHPVKIVAIGDNHTQVTIAAKQATIKGIPTHLVQQFFLPEGFTLLDLADWCPFLDVETEVIPLLTRLVTQGILFVEASSNLEP
ncbi:JmjC domain-containing protein [Laspinema palackyanum]|uniref:JmjC domain-containing protein n=1 Tax=Laspinema palackyanum TaxID=3231601 RepID=UPI00345C9E9E|nr:cupin domain-containing protein [Laspinema sp. D2c]